MTLSFTVDHNFLPLPRSEGPWEPEYFPIGVAQRSASGLLRVQWIAQKYRVRIYWTGLSAAERAFLLDIYTTYIQQAGEWIFPNGLTFTGLIPMTSWAESPPWYSPFEGVWYYDVSFTVEEQ